MGNRWSPAKTAALAGNRPNGNILSELALAKDEHQRSSLPSTSAEWLGNYLIFSKFIQYPKER